LRYAGRKRDRLPKLAAELVRLEVDLIVSTGTLATRVVKKATSSIPIVMVNVGDAVQRGIVPSLAHPGENITGLTTINPHLAGKRLELLKEAAMKRSGIAVGCSALLGFVIMFQSYDYFSFGVSFFKIPDSLSSLT